MDVCSLSGRVTLKPVSVPLPYGIRFFHPLNSASPSTCLAVGLPELLRAEIRDYHVPLTRLANHVGPLCPPAGVVSVSGHVREPRTTRVPFGPSLSALFGLFALTAVASVYVCWPYDSILTPHPDRASRRAFASRHFPRIPRDASAHCGEASYPLWMHQSTHAPLGSQ